MSLYCSNTHQHIWLILENTQKYQKTVKPRTENQAELMKAMDEKALVAALGPA